MRCFAFAAGLVLFSVGSHSAVGQQTAKQYYVTIGVFGAGKQDFAVRYTERASKMGFAAQYAINPHRKLYYVFLLQSDDRQKAISFMIRMRAETEFKDAWVFVGNLGTDQGAAQHNEPVTRPAEEPIGEVVTEPGVKPGAKPAVSVVPPVVNDQVSEPTGVVKPDSAAVVKPAVKPVAKGKFFTFEFLNDETGNPVRGEIHVQESKYAKQYQAFKANEMVDVPHPRNTDGIYFITTIAPGYKTFESNIDYKDPSASISETGPYGELIVPIHLERAKRGDYIEFNSVNFYRNSVIMQPAFKSELDGLVDLMKEHTDYELRIHGHCNGVEPRNIIMMGKSTKYFESDPANQKKTASAKELTELRAENTKSYLVSQGIDPKRLEVKGEGGKMMVYPVNSVYANYNDRVEMEIVRH